LADFGSWESTVQEIFMLVNFMVMENLKIYNKKNLQHISPDIALIPFL
jgi:hypothetical protein